MDNRKWSTGASANPPAVPAAPSSGYPTDGDPLAPVPPTIPGAFWFHQHGEELRNLIVAAGLTPSNADLTQVATAIQKLIEARVGDFSLDTGAANAYVIALNPPISTYTNDFDFALKIVHANNGASTINFGPGTVPLVTGVGGALTINDLTAGMVIRGQYINSDGKAYITSMVASQGLNQSQGDLRYAALAGAIAQTFNIGAATLGTHAVRFSQLAAVKGAFKNLAASTTGTTAVVTVTAEELVVSDSNNLYTVLRNLNLSASTGSASGAANSLDTGAWAFATWYARHIIYNPATQTSALLWSLSATAPTLPAGYTSFARVGWDKTQSSVNYNPLAIIQHGFDVRFKVVTGGNVSAMQFIASGIASGWVAVGVSNFVPPTSSEIVLSIVGGVSVGAYVAVAPNNAYATPGNTAGSGQGFPLYSSAGGAASSAHSGISSMHLESTNIYWSSSASNGALFCLGYQDNF